MAFNNVFRKMLTMSVVKKSVTYKAGVKNVHSFKVVISSENEDVVHSIALKPCPSAWTVC